MAIDMFLRLEGIDGESRDKAHKGEIDVLAFSWGESNSDGQAHAGKVAIQDLSLTKYVDKSSPTLFLKCAAGEHISKATLTCRRAGETPFEFLIVTLNDCVVTTYQTGGNGGEDRFTESISLDFGRIQIEYKEQLPSGGVGADVKAAWDVRSNKKGVVLPASS